MTKLLVGAWMVTALLTIFTIRSVVDGQSRDAMEGGASMLLVFAGAVMLTRKHLERRKRDRTQDLLG